MNEKLMTIKDLDEFMGLSNAHVRRYIITQVDFPKPIRVMPKAHPRWKYSDILKFIDKRKEV